MGEVMITVCRSEKLAKKMCEFLNDHSNVLKKVVKEPHEFQWWQDGLKIENKFTSFEGKSKVLDRACFSWAALKVGRKIKKFKQDEVKETLVLEESIPYICYGGFENWPVFEPSKHHLAPANFDWCLVDENGVYKDSARAYIYMQYFHPDVVNILTELNSTKFNSRKKREEKLKNLMRPWLENELKPIRAVMAKLNEEWN